MKKTMKTIWKTVKWSFIVFCLYVISLCFREEHIPGSWLEGLIARMMPEDILLKVESVSYGFREGLKVNDVRVIDATQQNPTNYILSVRSVAVRPLLHRIRAVGLAYERLPAAYYRGSEANAALAANAPAEEDAPFDFPDLGDWDVTLVKPVVLGVRPQSLTMGVSFRPERLDLTRMHLVWPEKTPLMEVDGSCYVDLRRQRVHGLVEGLARQQHIRPLIDSLDVDVALRYMDAFTEVEGPCPARCEWNVDLTNKDFDLWLDLHPPVCRYKGVPMRKADGQIHLHNGLRDGCLNYRTTVGPIAAVDRRGRTLDGTVTILGTNHYNTVDVEAKSIQPLADVLKIGGFTDEYFAADVVGKSECRLQFRFPRAMTNNYEVMDGFGHVVVKDGQLMRMKGFKGLIEAMPSVAPAVTWLSDTTQASGDYTIENGVLKTDNVYIEGSVFSIKMYGWLDLTRQTQDFTVRVQFAKSDTLVGKILHPIAWPFTKLLLEFKLTGSPDEPKWTYLSVIERVAEALK